MCVYVCMCVLCVCIYIKQICLHFDEIVITGLIANGQNNELQYSQWKQFRRNDNIFMSV